MQKQAGFTLVELIIAVTIIGILTAIALPNYQGYVRRTHCEDAKATITGAANLLERYRAQNNSYAGATLGNYATSPQGNSSKTQFNIAISARTATTYTLTATPVGMLAGEGTLGLKSTGEREATGTLNWNCTGL